MKVLGIDSSGMVASVALVGNGITLAEYTVNHKRTHSETLMPMLDEVVKNIELDLNEIDAIAISAGPGSFTGLRIGAATAKGLGLALEKPIVSVPTCHALAYNVWNAKGIICPIMDARRNQVYTGIYCYNNGELHTLLDQDVMDIQDLISYINNNIENSFENVIFLGDGVDNFKEIVTCGITRQVEFAPAHLNRQRAATVAALGEYYYNKGMYENADEHKPIYLRKSQAEREREERLGRGAE